MTTAWGADETQYFYDLGIETILSAVEAAGFKPTGAVNILNSMENRVYDICVVETQSSTEQHFIVKFYRPGRWTKQQIQDEHDFILELEKNEVPVIAPIVVDQQSMFTLEQVDNQAPIYYAFFAKVGGRTRDEFSEQDLFQLGRLLGRLHSIGSTVPTTQRLSMTPDIYLLDNLNYLLDSQQLPIDVESQYESLVKQLYQVIAPLFESVPMQRIHGDCHISNILWQDTRAMLIDFDDMVMGPVVQDIWLLLSGQHDESNVMFYTLLDGYETFQEFDDNQQKLIEPLRAMRYVHYATWLAKRQNDPAFQRTFLHFYQLDFWQQELKVLQDQLRILS